ncbi:HpcH/HpaI aldolase/citrate lyase family protein [Castellaniella sp.]|uniref:HpcH/HpaI aldolase/citrate lyase family protein n=1 Tax=Castellaniella sp. TaxID=1955812 RepID=UPI003A900A9F
MKTTIRSVLYVPGINPRMMSKALASPAHAVILDLEDSVAPEQKDTARNAVAKFLQSHRNETGERTVIIRVNGDDTPYWREDIAMAREAHPDAVLLPKVESAKAIERSMTALSMSSAPLPAIWSMVETALGILKLETIVETGKQHGLEGLVLGTNDLAKDSRVGIESLYSGLSAWISHIMLISRAFGVAVIDGVLNDIHNQDRLKRECERARDIGMQGKSVIHPAQISIVNQCFRPSEHEINWWKRIVDVYALPENRDKGVLSVDGIMVERLHLEIAQESLRALGNNNPSE